MKLYYYSIYFIPKRNLVKCRNSSCYRTIYWTITDTVSVLLKIVFITIVLSVAIFINGSYAQTTPAIIIDGVSAMANNISASPYWLTTGQTIAAGNKVNSISVLKYIIVPAAGGVGSTLQFKSTVSVTTQQTVPADETWKIESVALDLTASPIIQGIQGPSGATGATGPVGCTSANYVIKSNGTNAECSQIFDNGTYVGIGTNNPGVLLDLGVAGSKAGVVRFAGSSSGNATIQTAAAAGTASLTLPATTGNLLGTGAATSGQYASTKYTTTTTLNWANGNVQYIQLANGAQTFTFANPLDGGRYVLILKQPSSGAAGTLTWPGTVMWSGVTAPTLTTTNNKVDIITFVYDGTNYYAGNTLNY
ncbi:MAG: hypothetical protein HGB12_07300 [Bacteroidetes bacterium]|nr:hypothetical protein [Bacteroidota bacterium]